MDTELKQYLDGKFREVEARFQAMDTRFTAMDTRFAAMDASLTAMDARFTALDASLREHVSIECEKVETKLLTEFHKWGRTSEMRTRQAITDVGLLGERVLNVEDRISALERQRSA
jgi:hypothetical protein